MPEQATQSTDNFNPDNSPPSTETIVGGVGTTEIVTEKSGSGALPTPEQPDKSIVEEGETKTKAPITLDDFAKVISDGDNSLKDALQKKKEAASKTVAKTEDKPSATTETTETPQVKQQDKRDYSGLTDDERKLFRSMSNDSFNYLKPLMLEHKKLKEEHQQVAKKLEEAVKGKTTLPDSYYDHPQAFVLSEDYAVAQQNLGLAQAVFNHWKEQAAKVEQGEDWIDLVKDPKTGNIVLGESYKTEASTKANIYSMLVAAQNQVADFKRQADGLSESFVKQHRSRLETLEATEKKFFPQYEDPKYEGNKLVEQAKEELSKVGITSANPAFKLLAKSCAFNVELRNIVMSLLKENKTETSNSDDAQRAEPSGKVLSGGGTVTKTKKPITLDDYNRILSQPN